MKNYGTEDFFFKVLMQDKGVSTGMMDLSFSSFSFFPHGQTLHFSTWIKPQCFKIMKTYETEGLFSRS